MSKVRKENQRMRPASDAMPSVESIDTNTPNENIKILGIVERCGHLRIRKEANKEADVIGTIPVGTMVELVTDDIIDGFYLVHTETGYGYCMADFIRVITYPEKE